MRTPVLVTVAFTVLLTACNTSPRANDDVRQRAADATSTLKGDVQNAKQGVQTATQQVQAAGEQVQAAAEGVKEGLARPGTGDRAPVDINHATSADLQSLAGITPSEATEIISHRPYTSTDELRTRHILGSAEFYRISSQITAR